MIRRLVPNSKPIAYSLPMTSMNNVETPLKLLTNIRTPSDVEKFSQDLSQIIDAIKINQEEVNHIYDIPRKLKDQLDKDVQELIQLKREAKTAAEECERLKFQSRAVRKQIDQQMKEVTARQELENNDLEQLLKDSNQEIYQKWVKVKHKHDHRAIDQMLEQMQSKQVAIESMMTLLHRKLDKLSEYKKQKRRRRKSRRKNSIAEVSDDADDEDSATQAQLSHLGFNLLFMTADGQEIWD